MNVVEERSPVGSRTLRHRLELARLRAFVGRDAETDAFRAALANDLASALLFVHGAGGTGKTTLLRRLANLAEGSGRRVVKAGPFRPATSADALVTQLAGAAESSPGEAPVHLVLLVDDFDDWHPAEPWLQEELLPALPLGTVAVLAGRNPPALEWTTDPGWQELLTVHELGGLPPEEARVLLDRGSVPRDQHARFLDLTGGNPLALCAAIDAADGSDYEVRLAVAHVVLERVVGSLPTAAHRRTLELCATEGAVTQGALSAVGDAVELFRWLWSLPFVDSGPQGLSLQPFVREAVGTERLWREPRPAAGGPAAGSVPALAEGAAGGPDALSREDFDAAVRDALRSWRRPDLLATSPLVTSGLVADRPEPDRVAALRAVLQAALDELGQDPREGKSHRALLATYLGGAPTQEAAAERLGLPFSTYRRHLTQGLGVLGSMLWWQEIRGRQSG